MLFQMTNQEIKYKVRGLKMGIDEVPQGIYFLLDGDEIVYVGQSKNIFARIGDHVRGSKDFDSFTFIDLDIDGDDLNLAEAELIYRLEPKYNKNVPRSNGQYMLEEHLVNKFGGDLDKLREVAKQLGISPRLRGKLYRLSDFSEYFANPNGVALTF